jgi:hypothetical protein
VAQWFLESHSGLLSKADIAWLNAQRAAWLSVWEVLDVEPGRSLTLRDLLTNETRVVWETQTSLSLVKRDAVLGRVVDHKGTSVLCGLHPGPLPPSDAAAVAEQMRSRLRRKGAVPVERMREEPVGRYLIGRWERALREAHKRLSRPPVLQNTDGDPLLITVDHFAFAPTDMTEIRRRLAAAKEVTNPPEAADPEPAYVLNRPGNPMHRGWENTITGRATLSGAAFRLETNSVQRADSMRELLESLLGGLIHHRAREHSDPAAPLWFADGGAKALSTPHGHSEEVDRVILDWKTQEYVDWADTPLPALRGLTPREVAHTKSGRQIVDVLLKENENLEARLPEGQRFDFGRIRRDLGLEG